MGKKVTRLFEQFQPENYSLTLDIDCEAMTFKGAVVIKGQKIGRPSERITLHQNELKITSASIIGHRKQGDESINVTRINNQNKLLEVRLHAGKQLYPGKYTVTVEFEGKITRPMQGIYPCFFEHDGQAKKLIATQFESHQARDAFPCIDEPEAKATFDLTLHTVKGETVASNTPIKNQNSSKDRLTTSFETTPIMSTYLLAFVTGEMGYSEAKTKNGVVIRSYATPDNVKFTNYSVGVGVKILEFFEDYFQVPYPLQKMDMVALPDFAAGAMENWGLITYRESMFLVDDDSTSIETKQTCVKVVAHEMAHQWFGDLVTMKWWDDLWLNESFANMIEYLAADAVYPEWNIWEEFVSHEGVSARRRDSITDVQSVHMPVNHPDDIHTLFDPSIVYAKGGTLLHMVMHHIGPVAFREGLQNYFKKHAYGNTETKDLWDALSDSSKQDINGLMENWLHKPGFPLVTVDWEPGTNTAQLSQQRFLADAKATDSHKTIWQIPLASTLELTSKTLTKATAKFEVKSGDGPLLLNHLGQSYLLPYYSNPKHLKMIVDSIKNGNISDIDKLLLLDNYILLQKAGIASTTDLLNLLTAFKNETSETVWGGLAMSIGEARKLIEGDEKSEAKLNTIISGLVEPLMPELGWDDSDNDDSHQLKLRGTIYSMAASAKSQPIIDEALVRFDKMTEPADLTPSTRGISYFCAARYGNEKQFKKLLDLHATLKNADEKEEVAAGLTAAKDADRIKLLISKFKTDEVRLQDTAHWLVWLLRNRYSRVAAWEWLKKDWDWIHANFGSDHSFDYFVRFPGSTFSTKTELKEFSEFFEDKKAIVSLTRNIVMAEQEIATKVDWRERNEAAVKTWLAKH